MMRKLFSFIVLIAAAIFFFSLPSCGFNQHLVSIALQPTGGFVFEGLNAQGQFTAFGTYVHPPETKDITDKVVWSLNIGNFGTLTQTGQITYTRTDGCGSGTVTATFYSDPSNPSAGSAIVGSAPVKGALDGQSSCQ
jgi:hypothetical protein